KDASIARRGHGWLCQADRGKDARNHRGRAAANAGGFEAAVGGHDSARHRALKCDIVAQVTTVMPKFGLMLLILGGTTCVAYADPVVVDPVSIISWWIVVLVALVVEAGITALMVTLSGMYPLGVFFGFLACNLAVYF